MTEQKFTIDVNVKDLLTDFVPKLVNMYFQNQGALESIKNESVAITVEVSEQAYSYTLKNGIDLEVTAGILPNPLLHLSLSLDSMSKLAETRNIDLIMGLQGILSPKKYKLLSETQGTTVFHIKHPDGESSQIKMIFNAATNPTATIKLTLDDIKNITLNGESPIQMFMEGKLSVEGDLAYAIRTQSLFT